MRRRGFLVVVGGVAAWPLVARAQRKLPTIGFLNSGSATGRANFVAAFRRGLRELGFVEGQDVAIEYRWADDQYDRLPELAADLVRRQVSVIAAIGTAAPGRTAKAATTTIPIVFQTGGDPVKEGLVSSIARPEGNLTGMHIFQTGIESKRLSLLHELLSKTAVIAVLLNPHSAAAETQLQDVQSTARSLQRQIRVINATTDQEIDAAFANSEGVGALLVTSDPLFNSRHKRIVAFANRHALPAIYSERLYTVAGGLMSYGTDLVDSYRQTGIYVGRILKGERPADLPVLQSVKFAFVLNLETAKALGVTIPSGVLSIADEVIE